LKEMKLSNNGNADIQVGNQVQSGPPDWVNSFQQNMITAIDQKIGMFQSQFAASIDQSFNAIENHTKNLEAAVKSI
ncbi:UNVERIFIED_CONTAM: hypothetical protein ITH36_25630, partial [Salmonella enterica subsp. enterica serovar Weltevreden]